MSLPFQRLPNSVEGLIRTTLLCASALVVNAIATPYFLIAGVPITVLYVLLQKFYRISARCVRLRRHLGVGWVEVRP